MESRPYSWFLITVWVVVLTVAVSYGPAGAFGQDHVLRTTGFASPQPSPLSLLAENQRQVRPPWLRADAALFRGVLRLIRRNYVHEISDAQIFADTVRKLQMMLPPPCCEEIPETSACAGDPEDCLLEVIRAAASHCHMDADGLCGMVLNIILRGLDPYTCLLDESMLKELTITTSGKFGGVGVMVAPRNGDYVVISPFEGSPAYSAGIRAGDLMVEIDGQPLHDLPLLEVLRKVRGPVGSSVSLTVRNGKSGILRHVRLRRGTIVIPPIRYAMVAPGVGYLRIINFQTTTKSEVEKALLRMRSRGPLKGLILDLRDNPGGLLEQAVQVANLFVSSGTITSLRGRNYQLNREFKAQGNSRLGRAPIVVLINRGSASSSEILAGALQGKPHVTVMGERSFGKASVQAVYPLGEGNALRLTTAHYYTGEGNDIEGKGLEPDMPLEEPADSQLTEKIEPPDPSQLREDPWIMAALDVALGRSGPKSEPFPSLY